jgi:hypothetical protein
VLHPVFFVEDEQPPKTADIHILLDALDGLHARLFDSFLLFPYLKHRKTADLFYFHINKEIQD